MADVNLSRALSRAKRALLGSPDRLPRRVLVVALVGTLALGVGGAFLAARTGVASTGGSLPYLRPILQITTSVWAYVVVLAVLLRRVLFKLGDLYARQASDVTGYEPRTVKRLKYEAETVDGARVIATSDDGPEAIEARILETLRTGEDDTVSFNPAAVVDEDHERPAVDEDVEADAEPMLPGWFLDGPTDPDEEWRRQFKLFRLDIATSLNFSELFWRIGIPAALTSAVILLAVQLWVKPWFYPVIFAVGGLVGLLNYLRVSWKRSRRLSSLRQDVETITWSDVAIPVKEVVLPETRMFYGSLPGKRYAHDDREEFARELAYRAYELLQGVPVSPSVMEKQAEQLKKSQPDLHGYRDDERERIANWLLERVDATGHGLIPKVKLIEDCIEHDISERRFGPRAGTGFDPDLVREVYRELVPAALVEQDIELDAGTLTAVRLRSDTIPPEYGAIRAQFSAQFSNYARWDAMYDLPDVSDKLDEEPVYADSIWGTPA